jgi:hypothetical protein
MTIAAALRSSASAAISNCINGFYDQVLVTCRLPALAHATSRSELCAEWNSVPLISRAAVAYDLSHISSERQ